MEIKDSVQYSIRSRTETFSRYAIVNSSVESTQIRLFIPLFNVFVNVKKQPIWFKIQDKLLFSTRESTIDTKNWIEFCSRTEERNLLKFHGLPAN